VADDEDRTEEYVDGPDNGAYPVEAFLRFASDSNNWNYGPVLDITLRYHDDAAFTDAWDAFWAEATMGPCLDHRFMRPMEKPTRATRADESRRSAYGVLPLHGGLLGIKAGTIERTKRHGFCLSAFSPPRMVERLAPGWDEPRHESAPQAAEEFFRSAVDLVRRIRAKAPFELAVICCEIVTPFDFMHDTDSGWPQGTILVEPGFGDRGRDVAEVDESPGTRRR